MRRKNLIDAPYIVVSRRVVGEVDTETGEVLPIDGEESSGEVVEVSEERKYIVGNVDNFIKVFSGEFAAMREMGFAVGKVNSEILYDICERMSYADPKAEYGGQTITITPELRSHWMSVLGVSGRAIQKYLKNMVEGGHLIRLTRSTYMVNPYLYGKGTGVNVSLLRTRVEIQPGDERGVPPAVRYIG